jgi:hypothetical protein
MGSLGGVHFRFEWVRHNWSHNAEIKVTIVELLKLGNFKDSATLKRPFLSKSMTEPRDEFDSPWKEILEAYFQDFMQFFFPQTHNDIDWSRGYDFLDQELRQVVRDAELGKRLVDKLVKVWKLSGEETWVLAHIEIQSQEESQFSERMFVYYYRLRDRYQQKIVSLAILGDERETWRPQTFREELWDCEVTFRFPIIKLLDYAPRWAELESSPNPFAIAVMTHLEDERNVPRCSGAPRLEVSADPTALRAGLWAARYTKFIPVCRLDDGVAGGSEAGVLGSS